MFFEQYVHNVYVLGCLTNLNSYYDMCIEVPQFECSSPSVVVKTIYNV
jgi:hypothetical protein